VNWWHKTVGFQLCLMLRFVYLSLLACSATVLLSAQATLQITSPANGTVAAPGQSVTVNVAATGEALAGVYVAGGGPIGSSAALAAPPYQFSV
jgi:hypothetical protein